MTKLKENKKVLILFIITFLVIIDQIIKQEIIINLYNKSTTLMKGVIDITYVENTGGAFGIGRNSVILFILLNVVIIGLLFKVIISKNKEFSWILNSSIALIISGGIGNLIDRIFRGFVIDYIDINPIIKYPVFNFADICIVLGCMALTIDLIIKREKL